MKAYGYQKDGEELLELKEVTFQLGLDEIENLIQFFSAARDDLEKFGDEFGHSHLQDFLKNNDLGVDVIVAN
jgi:hypothetical protein